MKKNWPFIIITGFGIFATLVFLYFFVYGMAVNTVRSAVLLEKAYPNIKPEEYINELTAKSEKNNLRIIQLKKERNYYIIQIINDSILEKTASLSPKFAPLSVITVVVYDLGNGTAVVGNNPYIWDIVSPDSHIDDIAEDFSNQLSDIFDSIYWDLKKKKEILR
ncbi:MAG TPA: hypothetical protein DEP48_07860 [Persephonella sp.]|uniref:Uncharacterized protein n=1 Tax=Persephonella marina (strain DSM 14350 / EX-H1) TaxID=123214 RepID=C0QTV9_PERMH|nr:MULTISPECIES: hypothetical protein [Persephonella]ACO04807.1 hypothetical protein PERMA_0331 [Persephonella marina EX-H1]HCB70258.1 hypothetical protein [Persephonella sp.]